MKELWRFLCEMKNRIWNLEYDKDKTIKLAVCHSNVRGIEFVTENKYKISQKVVIYKKKQKEKQKQERVESQKEFKIHKNLVIYTETRRKKTRKKCRISEKV